MKRLVLALVLFPFIFPIHAEIIIEAPAGDSGVYQCMDRLPNGIAIPKGPIHKRWLDAQVECDKARKEDPDGDYWVKAPEGLRIIISGDADAAVMIRTQGGTESAPPASGEVGWTVTVISVDENAATLALEATRTDPVGVCDLFVNTANGTASAGTDYVAIVAGTDIQYGSGLGGTDSTLVTITNRPGVIQGDLTFTATLTKDDCTSDTLVNDVITVTIIDLDELTGTFPTGWTQPPTVIDGTILTFDNDVSYDEGTGTWDIVSNDGGSIFQAADHFTAPTFQIASLGDVTFSACVTASAPITDGSFAFAGVMLRESLNANSAMIHAKALGSDGNQGHDYSTRATTAANAVSVNYDPTALALPTAFRLEVDGALESWRAYISTNGSCASPSWSEYANGNASWLGTGDTVYAVIAADPSDPAELGYSGNFTFIGAGCTFGTDCVDEATSVDHSASTTVDVQPTSLNVDEDVGGGTYSITVQRAGGLSGASAVDLNVTGGTCVDGVNFTDPGTLTLNWANAEGGGKSDTIAVIDVAGEQTSCTIVTTATINSGTDTLVADTHTATWIDTDGTPPPQTGGWSTQGASGCSDGSGSYDGFAPGIRGVCTRGGFVPGTTVISVTNRNATGSGSLHDAWQASCPKVILFDVGGLITRNGRTQTNNCNNWSVAGASAPGNIVFGGSDSGPLLNARGNNWTIDNMIIAAGDELWLAGPTSNRDSINLGNLATDANQGTAIMLNNTIIWGYDGTMDCYPNLSSPFRSWQDVLFWQNIIGVGLGINYSGGVMTSNPSCADVSVIRNAYVHSNERAPNIRADGWFVANNLHANINRRPVMMSVCLQTGHTKDNPTRLVAIHNVNVKSDTSFAVQRYLENAGGDGCTTIQVYEEGNRVRENNGTLYNCDSNHACSGNTNPFNAGIWESSPITALYPTGYVPETIPNTQAGIENFASQVLAYAGARPADRLAYVTTRIINEANNIADGSDTSSTFGDSPLANNPGRWSSTFEEGGVGQITPSNTSWDASAQGTGSWSGGMPTGGAADAIKTSGLTGLHEWYICTHMDNVMPSGWREDDLETCSAP